MQPPTKLFNRNYLLLWQGQAVSRLGNQAFAIALLFWIKDTVGSAAFMGLALALSSLPGLFLEPIGGAVADRYPRRRIIIFGDLISGLAVLSLAALMYFAPQATDLTLIWLIAVSTLLATISAFFIPAIAASVPDLVPADRLAGANSLGQLSMQVSLFIGQGLGGLLFRLVGAPFMLLLNAFSFLYAATSESFVTIPQPRAQRAAGWRARLAEFRTDIAAGLRYVLNTSGLKAMVLITAVGNFFTAPILLLLPFYIENYLGASKDWYGFFQAALGAGTLLGFALVGLLGLGGKRRARVLLIVMFLDATAHGLLVLVGSPLVALALAVLLGCTGGILTVNITTLVQMTTPTEMRGRTMGLLGTISGSITPIAFGLAGVIADLTNRNIPLIYLSCSAVMLTLAFVILSRREIRAFLAYEPPTPISSTPGAPEEPAGTAGQVVPLN